MTRGPDGNHVVHFYQDGGDLSATLAQFMRDGIERRERPVILTTHHHWAAVCDMLTRSGHAEVFLKSTFVDAEALLRDVFRDGAIDLPRFVAALEAVIAETNQRVRIFGDVVNLLAARGALDSALALENIGHQLAAASGVHVLCAYDLHHLDPGGQNVKAISAAHDRAIPQPPGGPTHGPVVLLADDYEDTRDLYVEYLASNGYRVVTAGSGDEAIHVARTWLPDLILMDIRMPDMSGVDAMRALRLDARFQKVPIVAFTANARESARAECLSAGFDAVIVKPCLPDLLLKQVATYCSPAP